MTISPPYDFLADRHALTQALPITTLRREWLMLRIAMASSGEAAAIRAIDQLYFRALDRATLDERAALAGGAQSLTELQFPTNMQKRK